MKKRKIMKKLFSIMLVMAMMLGMVSDFTIKANANNKVESIIIDNTEAETKGNWSTGSSRGGKYGTNYGVGQRDNSGNTYMIWRPEIVTAGMYKVYYIQPDGTNDSQSIASNAHYTITYSGGTEEKRINQRVRGGEWTLLGTYYFEEGTQGSVKVTTDVDSNNTFGDAVKFEYVVEEVVKPVEIVVDNEDAVVSGNWNTSTYRSGYYGNNYYTTPVSDEKCSVTYIPEIPQTGCYAVYYQGPKGDADGVPYIINHSQGVKRKLFDQSVDTSGKWTLVGIYPFEQGNMGSVSILNQGQSEHIMADAFQFVLVDKTVDNTKFEEQGNWSTVENTEAIGGEYIVSEDGTFSFEYTPEFDSYYIFDYMLPEMNHELADEVQIQISEETLKADTKEFVQGMNQVGVCYLEAEKTYQITVSKQGSGKLIGDAVRIRCSGYDLLFENFDNELDTESWQIGGDWVVADGALKGTEGNTMFTQAVWTDGVMTAKLKPGQIDADFGMILSGTNNAHTRLRYEAETKQFVLYDEQAALELYRSKIVEWKSGNVCTLSVDYSFPYMNVSVNGKQIMELESSRSGDIGFFSEGTELEVQGFYVAGSTGVQASEGTYKVNQDQPRQTIWGLGIEVQSDSIGSGNNGLPESPTSVPHDLVQSERDRLYNDMLQGFRYLRLAGGLYYRGTDENQKHLVERWDTQNEELAELIQKSGIEGVDFEFWSPTPYFKSSNSYLTTDSKNTLKCFDSGFMGDKQAFLNDFADTIVTDLQYLEDNGIPIIQFGLQNEAPHKVNSYSHCHYPSQAYYETMKTVVPKVKDAFPQMHIHADSWNGQYSDGSKKIIADEELLGMIDAWTFHRIGWDSNDQMNNASYYNSNKGREDIVVYNNEFEYLDGKTSDWRCINTAQSIMNWMVFENSPTWHWLHMLKPLANSEATGYSLGFWRAPGDTNEYSNGNDIKEGYWDYNYQNFNAVRGFLKYMPWDSVRYDVTEDETRGDQRIMAYKTPTGKQVVVVTNRSASDYFKFNIDMGVDATYKGYRFTPKDKEEIVLTPQAGEHISPVLPPLSIEFWVEDGALLEQGITVINAPKKTAYNSNETFDPSELRLSVVNEEGVRNTIIYNESTKNDFTFIPDFKNEKVIVEYDGMQTEIAIRVTQIVEEADKEDLAALIDYANSQKENAEYTNVIPVVQKAFEKALTEAGKVNDNASATQEAVDAAYEKLLGMVHMLSFIKGETEQLQTLIGVVNGMNKDLYTTDSWLAVEKALEVAEKVLADENAMQDEIDAARDALDAAKDALIKISVDKTKLQRLADKSKNYEDAIKDYTPVTAEIFKGALVNAREVLENKEALQEMIDDAYATLQNAIFGLRLIPDKGKLEDSIKSAQEVDTANYTVKSATAFAAALDHAKVVFADENATEKQVEDAEKALEEAQKNLVAKTGADQEVESKVNNKADNKAVSDDGSKKVADKQAAKTGDAGQAAVVMAMLMAAAAAILSLKRKRR